jgi:signal transduction histidine kinase
VNAVIRPVSPARQSLLIAAVCLAVDVATLLGSRLAGSVLIAAVAVVIVLDSALALPAAWSGWVALAFASAGLSMAWFSGGGGAQAPHVVAFTGTLIVAYRAGAWLTGRAGVMSLVVLCAGSVAAAAVAGDRHWTQWAIGAASKAALPWMVGRFNTAHRAYLDDLRHQRDTERREAQAAVEKAVARERVIIARDLHDVISHHVSAIGMHAGAARMALRAAPVPAAVADSLSAVETSSRSAMADLRKMLDVLHGTGAGAAHLDELLDGVRRSGLPARLTVHGQAQSLPGSLDVALYRISQEMLTNALRHGDGGPVEICLSYEDGLVSLSARNGISMVPAPRGRTHGLNGIRTRAAMFGGRVSHGTGADGHWETTVTMPIEEAA